MLSVLVLSDRASRLPDVQVYQKYKAISDLKAKEEAEWLGKKLLGEGCLLCHRGLEVLDIPSTDMVAHNSAPEDLTSSGLCLHLYSCTRTHTHN